MFCKQKNSKVTYTYVYDKENDTVLSLTTDIVVRLSSVPEYATAARQRRDRIVNQMKATEGVKVTSVDGEKEIAFTVEIDMKKFKLDDSERSCKSAKFI